MRKFSSRVARAAIAAILFSSGVAQAQTSGQENAPTTVGIFGKAIAGVFGNYMEFLAEAVSNIFGALQGSFQPFAVTIVTLYVLIVGYKLLRGDMGAATKEFATSCFLIVFLASIVFSPGVYQDYVYSPFVGTVEDLSNFFVSKGAGVPISSQSDVFSYMGKTLDSISSINEKIENNVGLLDSLSVFMSLKVGIAQLILASAYVMCIAAYLYLVLQAWFAIFMYMIIGGVCVFFAAFKGTRFITVSWIKALCQEGLTIVFSAIIMGISGNIINNLVTSFETSDPANGIFTAQYFAVFLACILGFLMLLKSPQLASAMSGGTAGSTAAIAAGVGATTGAGFAFLKSSPKAAWNIGKNTAKGAAWVGSKLGGRFGGGSGASATPFSDSKGTSPTGD